MALFEREGELREICQHLEVQKKRQRGLTVNHWVNNKKSLKRRCKKSSRFISNLRTSSKPGLCQPSGGDAEAWAKRVYWRPSKELISGDHLFFQLNYGGRGVLGTFFFELKKQYLHALNIFKFVLGDFSVVLKDLLEGNIRIIFLRPSEEN